MESEKVLIPRENPRNFSSFLANSNSKAMPNEQVQKPPPPILDRFRVLLKQREDELRVSVDDDIPPPTAEEIVQLYEILLSELTFNSKPIITDLTIIAGEQREHGEGIADAICARIIEVPVEQKLPSLYLLDSIVKNIGRDYVRYFSSRLPEVFCEAYRQVHPNMYPSMRHLFGTWSTVFPPSVLRKIETQLQFSPSINQQSSGVTSLKSSESPRPTHGIHVNPKYLRQLEQQSGADSNPQHMKGSSSGLKVYGQRPAAGYDEFDSDHTEATPSHVGVQRLNPMADLGHTSFVPGASKLPLSSASRVPRPFSPSRIVADRPLPSEVDEFASDKSPRRFVDGASPSHTVLDYGRGRVIGRDKDLREWRRKQYSNFNRSNGHEHQSPRALIDAYGSDIRAVSNKKILQVERLDVNGVGNKVAPRSWQNTEEEEFDWEDMSPTLADRGRSSDLLSSSAPNFGGIGTRPATLEPDGLPLVDDSSMLSEDAIPSVGTMRRSNQPLGTRYPQEAWNLSRQPTHQLHTKGRGRDFQMPFSSSAVPSLGAEKLPPHIDKLHDGGSHFTRHPAGVSRLGSSGLDSVTVGPRPALIPSSTGAWPPVNVHKSQPASSHSIYSLPNNRSQFDSINPGNTVVKQVPNKPPYLLGQQFDGLESKKQSLMKMPHLLNQRSTLHQQNQLQANSLQSQFLPSQEVQDNILPSAAASVPPRLLAPALNRGYTPQGHGAVISLAPSNPVPVAQPPLAFQNMPGSLHLRGGTLPPLPPGPPPASQIVPVSQNAGPLLPNQPQSGAFSGLINSLMAQGLISLTNPAPVQDSVGLEFNADLLKVRHESAINSLYSDLPRQCTTCGLRFKCQEEHSSHMDWHVTKNRMSKNRKHKPSRKWFVSTSMWLSGAEALGTDAVPGFLPTETIVDKKDDEEMAVPADEDQTACALCGEPFDDFYSDETEEWMYKGAVYMNAPNGDTVGMDRSQLGPIVHAKCRSESSEVPPEDFAQDEGGNAEDGSQRKRMRS